MLNGQRPMMNTHRPQSARPFANRSKQWTSNVARPEPRGSGNAQRSYERYLALAEAQARSGDIVGAENYYQHAEHYFSDVLGPRNDIRALQMAAHLVKSSRAR